MTASPYPSGNCLCTYTTVCSACLEKEGGLPSGVEPPEQVKTLRQIKLEYVNSVIEDCEGNITEAARLLKIGRSTAYRFQKQYLDSYPQK